MEAYLGEAVFDGDRRIEGAALLVEDGRVAAVVPAGEVPAEARRIALPGALIAPGLVDVQVNGGGGVLLNAPPTAQGVAATCRAHAAYGSTALLPTVITDRPEVTRAAIAAVAEAMRQGVPGCAGIHVEGPFLAAARKGAHDPALIRPMAEDDLHMLAGSPVRPLLLTVAAETVPPETISRLVAAGITVSIGHSDASYDTARAAFAAGATGVTHLFNAMSQLAHREPGVVGAALDARDVWCGIIADGHHVHPVALGAAIRAKRGGLRRVVAVTDAMPTVGSPQDTFELSGRVARREGGRLTLPDGTLAGSDLTMIGAVHYLVRRLGVPPEDALAMASRHGAEFVGLAPDRGFLRPGSRADFVVLDEALELGATVIGGTVAGGSLGG